ncbi:MAG: epoxyqueuosine reductase QueH [Nitrospirota bacterium]
MKILMHICCANCGIYPLETFLHKGIHAIGLWYNPNIHPYIEYSNRLDSVRKLQRLRDIDMEYIDEYELDGFLGSVVNQGSNRCAICYSIRLGKTAEIAKKMGADGFTTSLLASPYQKFDMIIDIGKETGRKLGIQFYFEDFRKGWHISRSVSAGYGLYRQKYCGCIYSEMDRYRGKNKKAL